MYHLRVPKTEDEFEAYYRFRWALLRKPFNQPFGSEKDGYDLTAHHQMVTNEQGEILAIGRLYINADDEGAIRFLVVHPSMKGKGLGILIAIALESVARQEGIKRIVSSVREEEIPFFIQLGFSNHGSVAGQLKAPIRHFLMIKPIETLNQILHRPDWCSELQKAWYYHIPLSKKMGVRILQYTGQQFITTMAPGSNLNAHNSLFAGSLFSLATLTGWGLIWLLLQERHLGSDIVLVDASIRYRALIHGRPRSVADLNHLSGDLDRLVSGNKARVKLSVEVSNEKGDIGAIFTGTYLLISSDTISST